MSYQALNIEDFRRLARRRLPRGMFEYIDRGSEDEHSLGDNRRAFAEIRFVPSVLNDVTSCALDVELFGRSQPLPLIVAPTAVAGLAAYDGEVRLARAAAAAGIPFCVATQSITSMEAIAAGSGARLWFQLYVFRDRTIGDGLLQRAKAVGAEALLLTVDTAVSPNREYNVRNGFGIPFKLNRRMITDVAVHPRWAFSVFLRTVLHAGVPAYAHYPQELRTRITDKGPPERVRLDAGVNWDDVRALRRQWDGPLIIKGVLGVDDAVRAADCGADAIVVSNHGGRNLDGALPPVIALPRIVERVGKRVTVLADSGVRRGSDVLKLMALGAKAVLLGRAPLYGLAAGGEAGATAVLDIFRDEIRRTMQFVGRTSVRDFGADVLWRESAQRGA